MIKTFCYCFTDTRDSRLLITGGIINTYYFKLMQFFKGIDLNGEI